MTDLSYDNGYFAKDKLRYHGLAPDFYLPEPCSWHGQPDRRACPFCARGEGPHARTLI